MINPAFVVGAGFAAEEEATRLTRLNQTMIVGTLITGIVLSSLTAAGLSYEMRFLVLSGVALTAFIVVFLTNAEAAAQINAAPTAGEDAEAVGTSPSLKDLVFFSRFGVILVAIFLVSTGHGVITGQFPNCMDSAFEVPAESLTLLLSISAVVTLVTIDVIGRWMGRARPVPVWLTAVGLKLAMMVALTLLAFSVSGNVTAFMPLGLYLLYMQGIAWADLTQPALVSRISTDGAGLTQGLLMLAIALAFGVGGFFGGTFADGFGFQSLAWLTAVVSGVAFVFGFLSMKDR